MWGSSTPSVKELQKMESAKEVMKSDMGDDCLSCRLIGASAFMGLGAYTYFSGHHQLQLQQAKILQSKSMLGLKGRQAGITSIAISLVGVGVYRLIN